VPSVRRRLTDDLYRITGRFVSFLEAPPPSPLSGHARLLVPWSEAPPPPPSPIPRTLHLRCRTAARCDFRREILFPRLNFWFPFSVNPPAATLVFLDAWSFPGTFPSSSRPKHLFAPPRFFSVPRLESIISGPGVCERAQEEPPRWCQAPPPVGPPRLCSSF